MVSFFLISNSLIFSISSANKYAHSTLSKPLFINFLASSCSKLSQLLPLWIFREIVLNISPNDCELHNANSKVQYLVRKDFTICSSNFVFN